MYTPVKYSPHYLPLLAFYFQVSVLLIFVSNVQTQISTNLTTQNESSVSAVLIFGDSTVDPGNNNGLVLAVFKANFLPYGRDFVNRTPTGRFCNGRLVTDFLASYAGIKDYVPAYLDPMLSFEDLKTGVSFASAGSGYDPLTAAQSGVIPLQKQMEYFKEYRRRLDNVIGKEKTNVLINKSIFVVSAATNDFVLNYFGPTLVRRINYTVSGYQRFILQIVQQSIQNLINEGAQKIVIVGLPPMGCLPIVITLYLQQGRKCVEFLNSIARDYNQMLQTKIKDMGNGTTKILYADIYNIFDDIVQSPNSFGFDEANISCCGTGLIETSYLCNPILPVCPNASTYVFWDSIHPTESVYNIISKSLYSTVDLLL